MLGWKLVGCLGVRTSKILKSFSLTCIFSKKPRINFIYFKMMFNIFNLHYGYGRRSVKPHLSNHIYFKSNLSFVLFEVYREIVRKSCITSFPVDRPALALTAADSIETENPNITLFLCKFSISIKILAPLPGKERHDFLKINSFILSVCRFREQENS